MKAAVIEEYGSTDVLQVRADIAVPEPAPNQVLVEVKAAGINPLDWRIRKGELRVFIGSRFPMVLGHDGAGIVVKTGSEVTEFREGDRVFGLFDANAKPSRRGFARPGTYAEYAVTRTDTLARIPESLDFVQAASLPLASLTAWQVLTHKAGLQEGQSVLVNAASGGVGMFAVQIAKAAGARVTAVCGGDNLAWVKAFGADRVLDYRRESLCELDERFDIFYDVVVNQSARKVRPLLKPNGVYISNVATPATILSTLGHSLLSPILNPLGIRQRNLHAWVKSSGSDLQQISGLIAAGKLQTRIQQVYPLADVAEAHRASESGHVSGKLVLSI